MQPVGLPPTLYHRLRLRFAPLRRWKSLSGSLFVRAFSMHNVRGGGAQSARFRCTADAVWGALGWRNMQPYNIFEHEAFRLAIEKLFERQYPKDRFFKELDQEARYYFWAQIEWEFFITTWPPYIDAEEISRIISEYHIHRPPEQALPEYIDVNVAKWYKIDAYSQLRANWERFADYMWRESQK